MRRCFAGVAEPIVLAVDTPDAALLVGHMDVLTPHWPRAPLPVPARAADVVLTRDGGEYRLGVARYDAPDYAFDQALAAANGAVGGLIGTLIAQAREAVALHAAAIVTPLGAVVLLGDHNAGKSTLSVALAAMGTGFVADDRVVVVERPGGFAVRGLGIVPKLRLPLPDEAPAEFRAYVVAHAAGDEGTMQLVAVPPAGGFGQDWPLAALVVLERGALAPALQPLGQAGLLRRLVTLGFAPHLAVADRLARWQALSALPAYTFRYTSAFTDAGVLQEAFR
jgi:hypothetical protein